VTTELLKVRGAFGTETTVLSDPDHKGVILRHYQDTRPILAANRQMARDLDPHARPNAMRMRHVAAVPFVVIEQWCRQGWMERTRTGGFRVLDEQRLLRELSDPDNRWLRVDNGRRLA
jgi:hypothetical protein